MLGFAGVVLTKERREITLLDVATDMDSTMFGEGYQPGYDRPAGTGASIDGGGPDWWLIEVSALPFVSTVFEAALFA